MSADVAVVDVLYVNGKSVQQVNGKSVQFEHWNKSPDSVLFDGRISFAARCVYATLAGSAHGGDTATIGQRRIAELLGAHQETVMLAIRELEKVGHVESIGSGKVRRVYRLKAGVANHQTEPGKRVAAPVTRRKLILRECKNCHRMVGGLMRTGWCRTCTNKVSTRRLMREVALEVVAEATA